MGYIVSGIVDGAQNLLYTESGKVVHPNEIRGKSSSSPSGSGECISGFDAAVDAESVRFHPCTADDVYFRLWALHAVLPGVAAVLILLVAEFGCFLLLTAGTVIVEAVEWFSGWIAEL